MEDLDEEEVTHHKCLICSEYVPGDYAISLSDEDNKKLHKELIESIIAKVVEQHTNGTVLSSDTVCRKCFITCNEIHSTEMRLQKQRQMLMTRFKQPNVEIKIQDMDDAVEEVEMVPKKILDIPSSDDDDEDNSQEFKEQHLITGPVLTNEEKDSKMEAKKLTTLAEIEEELIKMHGGTEDDIQILLEDKTKQTVEDIEVQLVKDVDPVVIISQNNIKIETLDEEGSILKHTVDVAKAVENPRRLGEQLAEEMLTRTDSLYTCLMCEGDETVCGEAKAITGHLKDAHNARIYICDVCGDFFKKRNDLSSHMDDHCANEEGDFQCEVCHRIFNNLRLFRVHKRIHYPIRKSYNCGLCGKKCASPNILEEHMNTHTGLRPYMCSECGKKFASKYTFQAHQKTHTNRKREFPCTKCNKSFLRITNLVQHAKTHLESDNFKCHLCDKTFGTAHNLEVHSIVHTGYKPFICGVCGKSFARKAEIRDHERTHTGERPYQCEFCGGRFGQLSNLLTHKRSTHYDDKRHKCDECGKGFKRRRLLEYHIKAAHTGERPFKCNVCEATFVYPEHFKKHRRIHTGEKPFSCEICGKSFNSRDNRNAHRFVHSDKKPYECLICGAGFFRKPHLYQHMQTEGHVNDTIVVNQPRLPNDEQPILTLTPDGQIEIVQHEVTRFEGDLEDMEGVEESKLFIAEQLIADDGEGREGEEGEELAYDDAGTETIIIDGQQFQFKGEQEDVEEEEEEEEFLTTDFEGVLTSEAIANGQTQIIQTKDGPVQLLAVRIPNDNGEEEEAWIKILPEDVDE